MTGDPIRSLSVWATITGLTLVALLAIQTVSDLPRSGFLPMLLGSVVGFELFLFVRELMRRVRRRG